MKEILKLLCTTQDISDQILRLGAKTFAEIVKKGWNLIGSGDEYLQNVPEPQADRTRVCQCITEGALALTLFDGSAARQRVGLVLFTAVVQEMSVNNGKYLYIQQRAIACSFRDKFLKSILLNAIRTFKFLFI